ncbi:tRNA (adenosine(37)-N6)-threonylcarbamoyltransferase complex dimerization subunit type 1 TsaB [Microbacterium sp.]|uniref:tRNA (adenosine(37)-N6)-threonylcarbamoyltransferase complex dimerization subunit type 1 TsaB n=1 Tax=Microbacterium sp. TaxID=51671 RepID=UPI0039E2CAE2
MILGIDTSLGTAVGVVEPDGVILAERSSADPRGHAEVIGALLQSVLADAGLGGGLRHPGSLTHVAAGMGPGPFTGLRVGIAAARAFALGRGMPVVAVPSHDAAALEILLGMLLTDPFGDPPRFAVVTDARRREVAYSVYDGLDDDGLPVRAAGPALALRTDIEDVLDGMLDRSRGARVHEVTAISGAMVALVASRALSAGRELAEPEPLYLRAPDVTLSAGPKRVTR